MPIIIFMWFLEAAILGTRMTEEMQFSAHYWYPDNVNIPWILWNLTFSVLYFSALRPWQNKEIWDPYPRVRRRGCQGRPWGRYRGCAWWRWRGESPPGWTRSAASRSVARSESGEAYRRWVGYFTQLCSNVFCTWRLWRIFRNMWRFM